MTTPGNQELLEMIQILEQRIVEQQELIDTLTGRVKMHDHDLDDMDSRTNRLVEGVVVRTSFNDAIHVLRTIGALNDVDLRRGLL